MALSLTAWGAAALYFDLLPGASFRTLGASSYGIAMVGTLLAFRGRGKGIAICLAGFALVLAWWLTLKPSNERAWRPCGPEPPGRIDGDRVTIHNVRNCDLPHRRRLHAALGDSLIRPFTNTGHGYFPYLLGLALDRTSIVSFQFGDNDYIAMSIETRKRCGRAVLGHPRFFRYYELIYTVSDERDVVRLRTNYRKEETYLFHTLATPEHARSTFLNYLKKINRIRNRRVVQRAD
jgi:hypothetical protein